MSSAAFASSTASDSGFGPALEFVSTTAPTRSARQTQRPARNPGMAPPWPA